MSKCKGTPTYTQHTVAWPSLTLPDRVMEDMGISFDAKGGGTHGEFFFRWYNLGNNPSLWGGGDRGEPYYPNGALRVECFTDGLTAMMDDRVQAVLDNLRKHNRNPTPAKLIQILEANGISASEHHKRGGV